MDSSIWIALLSLIGTIIGTLGGIMAGAKLTSYRIEQLEKQVQKHNNVMERTFILEKDVQENKNDILEMRTDTKATDAKLHSLDTRVSKLEAERS